MVTTYNVSLIAAVGTLTLTVEADSAADAIERAVGGATAAFQRATQWHVSEVEAPPDERSA